jgi:uracil-DNA glycosylase family 4
MRTLEVIQDEVKACTKCELHKTRTNTVFARGNPAASICFVGEAPGQEEDEQGLPFVGKSGQLLDKTLIDLGVDIDKDIYVCNIIKCRPPNNRRPTDVEIDCCIDYLDEQLAIVSPQVIVALGNTAVSGLLPIEGGITKIHGKLFKRGKIWVIPVYHPSFIIRNGSSGQIYDDFKADIILALTKSKIVYHEKI